MASYGLPYKGSKNRIAKDIVALMPSGDVLYDVFAGGCAITHAAMETGKFDRYVINDIQGDVVELFERVAKGYFKPDYRWVSKEEFYRVKDHDAFVRLCWSFGNNGADYLFPDYIVPWKRALHLAKAFGDLSGFKELGIDTDGSNADIKANADRYRAAYQEYLDREGVRKSVIRGITCKMPISPQGLWAGDRIGKLSRAQAFERIRRHEEAYDAAGDTPIDVYSLDYRKLDTRSPGVIYCDPPYKSTRAYKSRQKDMLFDHEAFYDWCEEQDNLVLISEYDMPKDRFVCVWSKPIQRLANRIDCGHAVESIFVPRGQFELYLKRTNLRI